MAGIDDELRNNSEFVPSNGSRKTKKEETQPVVVRRKKHTEKSATDIVIRVVHYCIDGIMLFTSLGMMDYEGAYPLIFSFGLILWMAYRMLFFKRTKAIDLIVGAFLFVATVAFYAWALAEDRPEMAGRLMIPTVYLGFLCAWGAIRQKNKSHE